MKTGDRIEIETRSVRKRRIPLCEMFHLIQVRL